MTKTKLPDTVKIIADKRNYICNRNRYLSFQICKRPSKLANTRISKVQISQYYIIIMSVQLNCLPTVKYMTLNKMMLHNSSGVILIIMLKMTPNS